MEKAFSGQPTDFVQPHTHSMPCIWENVHMVTMQCSTLKLLANLIDSQHC